MNPKLMPRLGPNIKDSTLIGNWYNYYPSEVLKNKNIPTGTKLRIINVVGGEKLDRILEVEYKGSTYKIFYKDLADLND